MTPLTRPRPLLLGRRASLAVVAVLVATTVGVSVARAPGARATTAWSASPSLNVPRALPVLTVLANGDILALGGDPPSPTVSGSSLVSAEVYDRLSGEWSPAAPPAVPRADGFTATLLTGPRCGADCGKVLVAGGRPPAQAIPVDVAELYDPDCGKPPADPSKVQEAASRCAALPGRMRMARMSHSATLLAGPQCVPTSPAPPSHCGKVLVVGGITDDPSKTGPGDLVVTATAELYDPLARTWTNAGDLPAAVGARWGHTATPLPDGRIVIVGGSAETAGETPSSDDSDPPKAVLYDPSDSTFKEVPGPKVRRVPQRTTRNGALHTATAVPVPECDPEPPFVPCARLLVTGGNNAQNRTPWAELLELTPERQELKVTGAVGAVTGGTFTLTFNGKTTTIDYNATAAVVQQKLAALFGPGGAVAAGGPFPAMPVVVQFSGPLRDAGDQLEMKATSSLTVSEEAQRAGTSADVVVVEKLKGSNAWVPTGPTVQGCAGDATRTCRVQHTASPLPDGRVLVAGGRQGGGNADPILASSEIFDPTATIVDEKTGTTAQRGTWAAADPLSTARYDHAAIARPHDGGKVVVAGGVVSASDNRLLSSNKVGTPSVEVFTPATTPTVADLAVALVATPDPVAVGEELTYKATVTNHGPNRATLPTLAVTLGARLVFESAQPSGSCTLGATGDIKLNEMQRVTCRLDDLEKGQSVPVTIKARVASSLGGTVVGDRISSTAQVSSPTPEPSADATKNNVSGASTMVIAARNTADLQLDASGPADPVGAGSAYPIGEEITHRLAVTNQGPDDAHGVTLEALVPSGATVTPSVGTTCTGTSHVTCVVGSLARTATATAEVNFTTSAAHTGRAATVGVVRASEVDPVPTNNTASISNAVAPKASLAFNLKIESIKATPDPAIKSKRISYTIKASNDGPSTAPNVVLEDYPRAKPLNSGSASFVNTSSVTPAGVSVKATKPEGARCLVAPGLINVAAVENVTPGPEGMVLCALGNLAPGEGAEIQVEHDVGPELAPITNIARVHSPGLSRFDDPYGDNKVSVTTAVEPDAPTSPLDVWATMADAPDPVAVGEDLTYTVEVGNDSDGLATFVTLEDPLPDAVIFKSSNTTKGTCGADNGRTVRCDIGTLGKGERATIKIVVAPQASFASTLSNVATVSLLERDDAPANNVARATTTVTTTKSSADLAVAVTDDPDPIAVGGDLTYTVKVLNRGSGTAYHAGVTDTLPSGVVYHSSSATRGGCSHDGGTVTCSFGHLDNGADATATIVVRPASAGTVTNTVRVTSGSTDPDASNNSATTQTVVTAADSGGGNTGGGNTGGGNTGGGNTGGGNTGGGNTGGGNTGGGNTTQAGTTTTTVRSRHALSTAQGYTLVGSDGGIFNFGTSRFHGSTGNLKLNQPVIGLANKPGGTGYWLVAKDGGIFNFGDAGFFGSTGAMRLNAPILGMEPTPSGNGYYLFGADGGIFTFGDAKFHGSTGDRKLNAPAAGLAVNDKGDGYWVVATDGGIFSFGNVPFHGSTGGMKLNEPVFDMTPTADDKGYWLVAKDGGIFSFGDAESKFYGSAVGLTKSPVIGIGGTPTFNGYWIADAKGAVFPFGDAALLGDRRNATNNATIVGFATVPSR